MGKNQFVTLPKSFNPLTMHNECATECSWFLGTINFETLKKTAIEHTRIMHSNCSLYLYYEVGDVKKQ